VSNVYENEVLGLPGEENSMRAFEAIIYSRGLKRARWAEHVQDSPRWKPRPEQAMVEHLRDLRRREGMWRSVSVPYPGACSVLWGNTRLL